MTDELPTIEESSVAPSLEETFMQPCPACNEPDDIERKCWGFYLNYCNKCATLYEVFPNQDAKELYKNKKKKKRR